MSRDKSPATTYVTRMLSTTTRTQLQEILEEAPLSTEEKNFILDIHGHSSLKDLATKYGYTISGIAKKKQKVYTRLHRFDISRLTR